MNMIFNGMDLTQYFRIKDIRRDLLPPLTSVAQAIPGRPGSIIGSTGISDRMMEVDIRIKVNKRPELREKARELAGLLYTEDYEKLTFSDEPDKYYMAKIDGNTDIAEKAIYGDVTLPFLYDPLAYGETKSLDISGSLQNGGTRATTGIITVTLGAVDHLKMTLKSTGEYVYIKHPFTTSDTVTIDLSEGTAYKNGVSITQDVYLESDFFDIPVGTFEISLSSGTGSIEFTERWL